MRPEAPLVARGRWFETSRAHQKPFEIRLCEVMVRYQLLQLIKVGQDTPCFSCGLSSFHCSGFCSAWPVSKPISLKPTLATAQDLDPSRVTTSATDSERSWYPSGLWSALKTLKIT